MSRIASQNDRIYDHLASGKSITPLEALRLYGCMRLGARIWDLRQQGFVIVSELVKVEGGAHVASYRMEVVG